MTLRGRMVALGVTVVLLLAGATVLLVASRTPDCGVAAPRPLLPPALRALGDFDQAYDAGNAPILEDAAVRAAGALHPDLIGTIADPPVAVAARQPGSPDAMVLALRAHPATAQASAQLAGLVVFLRDCRGGAYFATVEDDAAAQPGLVEFPPVTKEQAAAQLGAGALRLVYEGSPLEPLWVTTGPPERSLPAR
jgi:hypothetical protein